MSEEFSFSLVENRKFVPKKTEKSYRRLVLARLVFSGTSIPSSTSATRKSPDL